MTNRELKLIQHFKILLDLKMKGYQVIAFGSRARGDADEDSDLDILVITEEPFNESTEDYVSHCAWETGFEDGIVISSIVISRKEWDEGPQRASLLALAVRNEGVPV
jgi:predicted nucleotidyltransferase